MRWPQAALVALEGGGPEQLLNAPWPDGAAPPPEDGNGDGKDGSGRPWLGSPTHMLSYSWSYSMKTIVDGLRSFEHENPPSKGGCWYYFIGERP